jgi:DNA-binding transcriptional LysR family regulator
MENVDLNLLLALDVLLDEGSVTTAARRLGLSTSAMSRTLARLRAVTGDPLLVRAGRGLVPTPHAMSLRDRVHALTREVQATLRPRTDPLDLAVLERTFTLRANEDFIQFLSVPLCAAVAEAAPRVRLRFALKPNKDPAPLREGLIDLEIGVIESAAPEMRTRLLFRDHFVGVARTGHPLLAGRGVTARRYAASRHVVVSRKAQVTGPVDEALQALGLRRTISVVVPAHADAMRLARQSDLVALVPSFCLGHGLADSPAMAAGLRSFELPVRTPDISISALWHPRMDADPAHGWLRQMVVALCQAAHPVS